MLFTDGAQRTLNAFPATGHSDRLLSSRRTAVTARGYGRLTFFISPFYLFVVGCEVDTSSPFPCPHLNIFIILRLFLKVHDIVRRKSFTFGELHLPCYALKAHFLEFQKLCFGCDAFCSGQ